MIRTIRTAMLVALGIAGFQPIAQAAPKNVILMISDGAGYNTWNATSYYQYGHLGNQVYDQPDWVKFACSTYPLSMSKFPTGVMALAEVMYGNNWFGDTTKTLGYDPVDAWDPTPTALVVRDYYTGGPGSTGAFRQAESASATARRVSTGSRIPSSHSRAVP